MCYELKKPFDDKAKFNFLCKYNRGEVNLRIEDTEMYLFALEPNEIMGEKEIEIDVPDFEIVEEEYEETTQEPLLDANGEVVLDENNEPIISTTTETKTREVQKPVMVEVDVTVLDDEGNETTEKREVQSTHKETITIPYPVINPNYEQEQMDIIRPQKLKEASDKAKLAIENGYVEFDNAKIETNAQTVGDLTATMLLMQAGGLDTYSWLSMDDEVLELSVNDIASIGGLIAQYKNEVWNTKYLGFVEEINNAETLEELQNIEIIY